MSYFTHRFFLLTLCLVISSVAWAHRENEPGPNGGHIRMPGAFHTEVVPEENGKFAVYLLDIGFKNPVVKDSLVAARIKKNDAISELTCVVQTYHFLCSTNESDTTSSGELEVTAKRDGKQGTIAKYELPLVKNLK